jgi:glutamine---fructose-6-phosphate transaminase (isomerizing)
MCGLIGAVARRNITPILLDGLKRLEYRGYDSAGLALITDTGADNQAIDMRRCVGRVADLEASLGGAPPASFLGMGHTRWATHGEPEERNAHPHLSNGTVAVVHNGIIENYEALRKVLEVMGYHFLSDTDTEVVAHLVHYHLKGSGSLLEAVRATVRQLSGAYAIAVMASSEPGTLVVTRQGNPLVLGLGEDEHYVASDAVALLPLTQRFVFPQDGDVISISGAGVQMFGADEQPVQRPEQALDLDAQAADKGPYRHYMLKEIHEQPDAVADTLQGFTERDALLPEALGFPDLELLRRVKSVHLVACGTSFHAAEVGRYWLESMARLPCMVDLASEYRYRDPVVPPDCLFMTLSQSGETADTLAALRYAKQAGYLARLAICNVPGSSLARESDATLLTRAGPEMGVASTKAFTTQLVTLLLLTVLLSRRRWHEPAGAPGLVEPLRQIAGQIEEVLQLNRRIEVMARRFADRSNALYIGRGVMYPIAKEGALKLKEISYIHAEAYAAGELKHGPLALVTAEMPVVALAPSSELSPKLKSNLREIQARGGKLYVFADAKTEIAAEDGVEVLTMPAVDELSSPIAYTVALQLLAYHVAVLKGTDVDKPRNLAKSVTVE